MFFQGDHASLQPWCPNSLSKAAFRSKEAARIGLVMALFLTTLACAGPSPSWERTCRLLEVNPATLSPPKTVWLNNEEAVSRAHFWLTGRHQQTPAFYSPKNHTIYTCRTDTLPHEYAHAIYCRSKKYAHLTRQEQEVWARWLETQAYR